jgi:hypothetical protein
MVPPTVAETSVIFGVKIYVAMLRTEAKYSSVICILKYEFSLKKIFVYTCMWT